MNKEKKPLLSSFFLFCAKELSPRVIGGMVEPSELEEEKENEEEEEVAVAVSVDGMNFQE